MNFDPNKDYYGILGVTPTAELAVIKAAYKALAAIYHPDRNSTKEAVTKMQAINEAWDILSDPSTRKRYDEAIGDKKPESDAFDETSQSEYEDDAIKDYFEKDWNFALSYYPDLAEHASRLGKISRRLEIAYRAFIVSEKCFKERKKLAKNMEQKFLETYFSSNEAILQIAKKLIFVHDDKELLRELNKAVSILGTSDPDPIVTKFTRKLNQKSHKIWAEAAAAEAAAEEAISGWGIVWTTLFVFATLMIIAMALF